MSDAGSHRRLLTACALAAYAAVLLAFVFLERPGLGLGHFFYVPICLLALAYGGRGGAIAGLAATALYACAVLLTPRLPSRDLLTLATVIRGVTFCGIGVLVGRFAGANRALVERLRDLADRDYLTGLANARAFDARLAALCATGDAFVLLLGDVDNLKEINDTHGHDAGNRAISLVAEALSRNIAEDDHVARVGGDEFAVLTRSDLDAAAALCARLTTALAVEGIRVSFGWAAGRTEGHGAVELFRKADDRLYAAKLVARNRTHVAALAAVSAQ